MPVYLDTRGNSVLSVAICDRCNRKFAYVDLMPDPNFPGMRVCKDDLDKFDPWRLPARQTENIALRFPRPDVSIATRPNLINTQGDPNQQTQYDNFFIDGQPPTNQGQGVLDISPIIGGPSPQMLNPSVTGVIPNNGPQAGGTPIIISGLNFSQALNVTVGGTQAAFTIDSPSQITAITPAYAVTGIVDVSVISAFGTGTSHGAFTYT
tara:strand:- start:3445 stop:4068 length:624 start_codon:yes stop_codon:yes gene_type:complete